MNSEQLSIHSTSSNSPHPSNNETESRDSNSSNNGDLVQRIKTSLYKQERNRAWQIIQQMRQISDLQTLLDLVVSKIHQELKATRVFIYQFENDYRGKAIAESLASGWVSVLNETIDCHHFGRALASGYLSTSFIALGKEKTEKTNHLPQKFLKNERIRSSIVLPILSRGYGGNWQNNSQNKVAGLLIVQQGDRDRVWQEAEINFLDRIATELSSSLQAVRPLLQLDTSANVLTQIEGDFPRLIEQTLPKIREELQADRVIIYGFNPDFTGEVLGESVAAEWKKIGADFDRDCFITDDNYRSTYVVNDIQAKDFAPCLLATLEGIGAKAYVAVPILSEQKLLGILTVFQNSRPRQWQTLEVELIAKYAHRLSLSLEQFNFIRHAKFNAKRLDKFHRQDTLTVIYGETQQAMSKMLSQIRQLLRADRALIYGFNPDGSGEILSESVGEQWVKAGNAFARDCYLTEANTQASYVVDDIYTRGFPPCLIAALETLQAKAYVAIPVYEGQKLVGMLAVYQNSHPRSWQATEIELVTDYATKFTPLLQQTAYVRHSQSRIKTTENLLARNSDRETATIKFSSELVSRLAKISQEEINTNNLLEFATKELRQLLKTDRVAVYRFNDDWSGQFILESVGNDWTKLVGTNLAVVGDTFLQENAGGRYRLRESLAVNDIYQAGYQKCHLELLESWETKAYAIAPIFLEDNLWGLLGVYQNDRPRQWEHSEVEIIKQVGSQIGLILQLEAYVTQLRTQETQMIAAADRERSKREQLQQGALRVLRALQPSFQGDLTVRAPLSEDEIGTIADGYNTTIQSLRELVRQVQISAEKVSDTSGNNTASVTELSAQAQQQVNRLGTALSELQLMVQCANNVTVNAEKVEQAVQEANQTVQNSDDLMEQTVDSILEVRDTVSETAKKIKQLGEASQRISKVVNLIDNFATQTNLLSLNAAIEATRAGEYGKGFAVVADEVRTLAYQSTNATTEIEKLVEEIQVEISEVTAFMEIGISQVVQGSKLVDETRQSLREIVTVTQEISGLVECITEATRTQNQQSQILTEAMTDVSTLANRTFANSTQISQSFQELLITSEELQTSVSRFKVD